ncbi:ATP synthase F1 subunit gamma [Candidatus Curtissbacteria bacterium]|nr:ATP synthase F1 subunit gamma [Candidatus Curtissbacteria bacterium]
MAQLREIRKRIKSVESTKKVTHAMELVAAAKMRKSQQAAISARPYSINLHEILAKIQKTSRIAHSFLRGNDSPKEMKIIITSDRGLTGGLNINIFREILKEESKTSSFVTVGKKAQQFAGKMNYNLLASFGSEEIPQIALARQLTKIATKAFLNKEVSKVSLFYPHFESTVTQTPRQIQVLPILPMENTENPKSANGEHLFEPSINEIVKVIMPHHILTEIFQTLLEAKASEHSARMVAMKNATDAAGDLIDDLTLNYNQARQEMITKELLDIVTAQRAFR